MNLLARYKADIAARNILPDVEQERVLTQLQRIHDEMIAKQRSVWAIKKMFTQKTKPIIGLYLWGSVGVGKTYLMDLFYDNLAINNKLRMHFHPFMAEVHQLLTRLQGHRNPLQTVARYFAAKAQVLCFDEFLVNDIADAMLLGNLLAALFERGVCLVATSNIPPAELYRNGLQRSAFLPAIALLEKYTQVEHILIKRDYRLRCLEQASTYFYPLDVHAEQQLLVWFEHYAEHKQQITNEPLLILNRFITVIRRADKVIWFNFKDICHSPRSQNDYIAIARQYEAIIISHIPVLTNQDDAMAYFINLVDICYDRRVKLIISASVPIVELYQQGQLTFEFQRTVSRLLEMQSVAYINSIRKNF